MKTIYAFAAILIALISTAFICVDSSSNKKSITNNTTGNGFAVIELFTSEGCSSCPAADAVTAKISKEYDKDVYLLSYHVDYWDNLGWKDIFSNADYTNRQRNYARVFNLSSVYTPQVVVNGNEQFVGSDENKLHAAINKDLNQNSTESIEINAQSKDSKTVDISFKTNAANNDVINIALVQTMADSQIKRGENSGALLHHVNIVRDIKTLKPGSNQSIVLNIPSNLSAKDCFVIAFAQDAKNMKITAATKAVIN